MLSCGALESRPTAYSAWTVIAAAVALLYLVWVTLEILAKYVGDLPHLAESGQPADGPPGHPFTV